MASCAFCVLGPLMPEVLQMVHTESVFVGSDSGKTVLIYAQAQIVAHPEPFYFVQ